MPNYWIVIITLLCEKISLKRGIIAIDYQVEVKGREKEHPG